MALVLTVIYNFWTDSIGQFSDPLLEEWFLVKSPLPILVIIGFYLYFVMNLGPKLMKNLEPFNLDTIIIIYNMFNMGASFLLAYTFRCNIDINSRNLIYLCNEYYKVIMRHALFNYNFFCHPIDHSLNGLLMAKCVWCYFLLKIVDLLDTIFFVLRKKESQISFLHVYHHAGVVGVGWIGCKFVPGGSSIYVAAYNSAVHAIMYFYYLLTVLNKNFKYNLSWKKCLTQLQIVQFTLLFFQFTPIIFDTNCSYPKWVAALFVPQIFFMTSLFLDFYIRTYIKTRKNTVTKDILFTENHTR